MKKITSVLLVICMVSAMSMTAFAGETTVSAGDKTITPVKYQAECRKMNNFFQIATLLLAIAFGMTLWIPYSVVVNIIRITSILISIFLLVLLPCIFRDKEIMHSKSKFQILLMVLNPLCWIYINAALMYAGRQNFYDMLPSRQASEIIKTCYLGGNKYSRENANVITCRCFYLLDFVLKIKPTAIKRSPGNSNLNAFIQTIV